MRISPHLVILMTTAVFIGCAPTDSGPRPALDTVERVTEDPVIARVEGTVIYASDVTLAAQEQGLVEEGLRFSNTHSQYRDVLDELIDQRLLALDAAEQGFDTERTAQIRLAAARERILSNIRVERHLRDAVNETSIRRIYNEQAKLAARGDEVRARHILVKEKSDADDLLKLIKDGADFAALAKVNSIDEGSAERGGDLGYFTQDMLNARFTGPAFNTAKGEYVGPVKSEFGWHIAEVLDRRPAKQPTFEELKPKLVNFMTFDAIQDLLTDLRDGAEIEIVSGDAPATQNLMEMGAAKPDTPELEATEPETIEPETIENE